MQNGFFNFIRALRGPEPPAPVVVHPTQVFDECLPDIEDYWPRCPTGMYALDSDELAFGSKAAPPDMMGLRSRYDRASDCMLTVIGVPGRLPIGLLLLLLDLTLRSRDSTLARLLTGRGTRGAMYFGDRLGQRLHPLLAEAQGIAEVIRGQLDREANVANVRAYSHLFCDMADSFSDVRLGGGMVSDATAELLDSPLRLSAKEASHAYLHHLVDHLANRLQAIPGLLADGMVVAPSFRAIAIVETDASAF